MSPTRRDFLAALGASGVAMIPAIARTEPEIPAVKLRALGTFLTADGDTSNSLVFGFETNPVDGTTTTTVICGLTRTSETFVSESPEVARFVADLAERIDWFVQDWAEMSDDEREGHRRRAREESWRRSKKPCPVCNTFSIITTLHAEPDCPLCLGTGYVI